LKPELFYPNVTKRGAIDSVFIQIWVKPIDWTLESAASYWMPIFITEFCAVLVFYAMVLTKVYQGYKIGLNKVLHKYEKY
jgi:hypothetical protein